MIDPKRLLESVCAEHTRNWWQIQRKIIEGQRLPWGYGVAWFELMTQEKICYPVPLNLVMRFGRWAYYQLARGPRSIRDYDIYQKGFEEGQEAFVNIERILQADSEFYLTIITYAGGELEAILEHTEEDLTLREVAESYSAKGLEDLFTNLYLEIHRKGQQGG